MHHTPKPLPEHIAREVLNHLRIDVPYGHTGNFSVCCVLPGHLDSSPSMSINLEKQTWKCWGCQETGTIRGLAYKVYGIGVQKLLNLTDADLAYQETLNDTTRAMGLKRRADIESKKIEAEEDRIVRAQLDIRGPIYPIDPAVQPAVARYLADRSLEVQDLVSLGAGYASALTINGYPFTNRLMIPIYDGGRLVSYEGRTLVDEKPKVLYPPGGAMATLLGHDNLDRSKPLHTCEGAIDLLILRMFYPNSTCFFGTSLNPRKLRILREFPEVIHHPDNDWSGYDMAVKLGALLNPLDSPNPLSDFARLSVDKVVPYKVSPVQMDASEVPNDFNKGVLSFKDLGAVKAQRARRIVVTREPMGLREYATKFEWYAQEKIRVLAEKKKNRQTGPKSANPTEFRYEEPALGSDSF